MKERRELQKTNASPVRPEETRAKPALVPAADIYERADSLVVLVDMPGVAKDSVEVNVERNVLSVAGRAESLLQEGHELSYSEYEPGDYRREFVLSNAVDSGRIEATVKHGVLQLVLPKAGAAQPRRITVKGG